jgi:hypothetical protein
LNRELSAELDTKFGYDPATGAVNEIEDSAVTTGPYTVEADRHYTRNDAGDVTGIATTGAAGVDTQCFPYDYLHDLNQAWTPADNSCATAPSATNMGGAAPYWTGYTIDPATGNRTQVVHNPTTASRDGSIEYECCWTKLKFLRHPFIFARCMSRTEETS